MSRRSVRSSLSGGLVTAFCCMIFSAPASASVPSSGWGFGIADDSGVSHLGTPFKALGPKIFRIQIPWDAAWVRPSVNGNGVRICTDKAENEEKGNGTCDNRTVEFRNILQHARNQGVQNIAVTIRGSDWELWEHSQKGVNCTSMVEFASSTNNCYPDATRYSEGLTHTVDALDDLVDFWGPANEPNTSWMTGAEGAGVLGQYWKKLVAVRNAKDPTAKLTSPDFHDRYDNGQPASIKSYLQSYWSTGGGFGDVVAWHPYNGVWNTSMATTASFLTDVAAIRGNPNFDVWLTEIGSYYKKSGTFYGPTTQNNRVTWLINQLPNYNQITRVYYYNMGFGGEPDSGLLNEFGEVRPAWTTWCLAADCAGWGSAGGPVGGSSVLSRDFSGDDQPDFLARKPFDGTLWMFKGNGIGGYASEFGAQIGGAGWSMFDKLFAVDWSGDGNPDVIARKPDGTLWAYWGNGGGGFSNPGGTLIGGGGWSMFDSLIAGDWSGDGKTDIIARKPDGTLWMYRGNGSTANGGFLTGTGELIGGGGWGLFNMMVGVIDFSGDWIPDIIARKPDGTLWMYRGNGSTVDGGFLTGNAELIGGGGWNMFDRIFAISGWSNAESSNLIARKPDGSLWLYKSNNAGGFTGGGTLLGGLWTPYDNLF